MNVRDLTAAAVIATSMLSLTGCEQEVSGKDMDAYVEDTAKSETMAQVAKEDIDLKDNLTKLQEKDPSVKDAYYSVDDKGQKQLHVVREDAEKPDSVQNSVWPIVGAMAGGAILGNMLASGGANNYVRQNPPAASGYYAREDEKKNRNTYSGGYVGSVMNTNRNNIYSATPPGSSALRAATLSTRSTGIWGGSSGGSSARAASHSSSSGG